MARKIRYDLVGLIFCLLLPSLAFAESIAILEYPPEKAKGLIVVSLDPSQFQLKLLTVKSLNLENNLTAREWVEQRRLIAAINAGMYQEDHQTSVSLLTASGKFHNPRLSKDKTVLAFESNQSSLPYVQIIDRTCQPFDALKTQYNNLLQGIRMVSCHQTNTWTQGGEKWPIAALGMDKKGRLLFLFGTQPLTPHDFVTTALALPLDLYNMMYLEGGPPAHSYLKYKGRELDLNGSSTHAAGAANRPLAIRYPIPNVLGVAAKK